MEEQQQQQQQVNRDLQQPWLTEIAVEEQRQQQHEEGWPLPTEEKEKQDEERPSEEDLAGSEVHSENEGNGGRIHRERQVLGEAENIVMAEVVNITSFDQNKEALIRSKAKVVFVQEH